MFEPPVGGPGPPQQGEDDQRLKDAEGIVLLRHQAAELSEGEHEREVEEEFERGDAVALATGDGSDQRIA